MSPVRVASCHRRSPGIAPCGLWLCGLFLLGLLSGCFSSQPKSLTPAAKTPGEIRLIVVDDPGMADAIVQLKAEWKARTENTLIVSQSTWDELLAASSPPQADAIIYPSAQLGVLADRKWIVPLPEEYKTNKELAWSDTFELSQVAETQWSQASFAIPLGSPVFTLFCRADLLAKLEKPVPRTWAEYQELAKLLHDRARLGDAAPPADAPWSGTIEPLARPWSSRLLLARAAPYAKHRDNYSTLFNIETMEPLIAGPAFVRALEELVATAKLGPGETAALDPAAARRAFLAGQSGMVIGWPSHVGPSSDARDANAPAAASPLAVEFAPLPGSPQAYHAGRGNWEKRGPDDPHQVPLLGIAGRMGSVTSNAKQTEQAFSLLVWLSGQEWGAKISSASPATTLFRRSQVRAAQPWLDAAISQEAGRQYAESLQQTLNGQTYLFALRIPGQEQYLSALDDAVAAVLSGQQTAAEALATAAEQWSRITSELGRDQQRAAYRKSLGLEP